MIRVFSVGFLNTNCYMLIGEVSNSCLILDPGGSAETISSEIIRQNLQPQAILATHGHYDHILGAHELQLAFEIPFYVHEADAFLVKGMRERAQHWMQTEVIEQPPQIDGFLTDGQQVQLGEQIWQVLASPGHTPGGICLFNQEEKVVFTGDTLFADAVGRTDLSYSSKKDLKKSLAKIKEKFAGYHAYPGHGEDFYI